MIGAKLANRYEILAELGRGGMGVVYRARDPLLAREVAVKLLPQGLVSSEAEESLAREARVVAQMDHPAIVPIHDFGRDEAGLFFVMPLLRGRDLRGLLREGSLRLGEAVDIAADVAEALDYSHSRGVVHRDIKPENVMVSREGERLRVRVMDFGLARWGERRDSSARGGLAGTVAYLSPEQVAHGELDGRSDIYSLGVVLFECLVGEPPFSGEVESILYRISHEEAPRPSTLGRDVDPELENLVLRCLAKSPGGRPQRALELADALRRYRGGLRDSDAARALMVARPAGPRRAGVPTFIGREGPFADLQQRLAAALAGECQLVVVGGEPGVGKTRLLEHLERLAKARRLPVLHGRFVQHDQAMAYQGFCDLLQEYFRTIEPGSPAGELVDFVDLAPDLLSLFPVLAEIPGMRSTGSGVGRFRQDEARKPENRTQVFELLARALARIAGGRPLVLLLENLHEAEVSVDALQYLVRRLGPTPTLIVTTYRTTEVGRGHPLLRLLGAFRDDPRFVHLALEPFSLPEHRRFVESLLGGGPLSEALVVQLFEAAEGNPLFTRELVRSLLGSSGIKKDEGGTWDLQAGVGHAFEALPQTIRQAMEKRIEHLSEDLRDLLAKASILGRTFDFRDLELVASGGTDLEEAVERLLHEGLIEEERGPRGDRLSFSTGVLRDVLYAGLPRRTRRALHLLHAQQLERRHAGRLERVLPQLVYHFSQADIPDKTVKYGLELAAKCLGAFSPDDASRAVRTVLEYVQDEDWEGEKSLEGEARMILASIERMKGNIEAALREAGLSAAAFEHDKKIARVARVCLAAAETAWEGRRVEEARHWVERGIDAARGAGEAETLGKLLARGATVANLRGEYLRAKEYLDEVERWASKEETRQELSRGGRPVVALSNPVSAAEPARIVTIDEEEVLLNVFETLLAADEEGNLIPSLCEKWEARERGQVFALTLRKDVSFHDGHPLHAAEVKASFERSVQSARAHLRAAHTAIAGVSEYLSGKAAEISGLLALGEHELEVRLVEPLPIFPALLTDPNTAIVRAEAGEALPVGTGPFRLVSHEPGRVLLERHAGYWGTPALLDGIEFRSSLSASAIAAGFRRGEFDVVRDLLPQDLDEILRDPRVRPAEASRRNVYFVLFNAHGPLGSDPKVRRSLCSVVRTHDLVWRTLGRFAQPASGLIPPGIRGHDPGRKREYLGREVAAERLRSLGQPMPLRLRAAVHPLLQDRYEALTRALFEIWAELGVEVEITTPTMEAFLEANERNEGLDLRITRWNADYDDPDDFTYGLFHSRNGQMRFSFCSPETDRLAEEARIETRLAVREALYRKFENLLLDSDILLPLFHDIDYRLASPRVRRLKLRASPPYVNYAEIGKAETAPREEEARRGGGVIHVPLSGYIPSLDPSLTSTVEQGEVMPNVFETLTRDVEEARIVPWLASSFGPLEGGRKFHFRLRDGVRFHDGRRLTSRDVRYSYERLLGNRQSLSRALLSPIKGAKAVLEGRVGDLEGFRILSASEFTIELEEPVSFFPALLCFHAAAIVPEGSDHFEGSWRDRCVGTGPFRVIAFEPGRRIELERNPHYWRAGFPRCDGLIFHAEVSPGRILAEFRAGRLHLASDLFPADVKALRREPEFFSGYHETPRLSTYFMALNAHCGPLADLSLRHRLVRTADAPSLIGRVLGRLAIPAHGVIPPGLLGYDASRALSSPGVPGALEAPPRDERVELTAAVHPIYRGEFQAVTKALWEALLVRGILVRVVNESMAEFVRARSSGEVDLVLQRWIADYPDADSFVHGLLHTTEGSVGRYCGCEAIDRLIGEGRAQADPRLRHALYREVEEVLTRDALVLPLFHEQVYRFARPEVEGLKMNISSPWISYENLSLKH